MSMFCTHSYYICLYIWSHGNPRELDNLPPKPRAQNSTRSTFHLPLSLQAVSDSERRSQAYTNSLSSAALFLQPINSHHYTTLKPPKMPVSKDDILVIALLLTNCDLGHPWEGIHSAYNCYFEEKDHWETIENFYVAHDLRSSRWHETICYAVGNKTMVSDQDAKTIEEVMDEFQEKELVFVEIWRKKG